MPDARFYCPMPLAAHQTIRLPEALAHHITRVCRLRSGAALQLFDGRGGQHAATLQLRGREAWAEVHGHDPCERELGGTLNLAQGMATADKMDWVVEKAVELGVAHFFPIRAEHSVLRLSDERAEKRLARWRKLVTAASEQCGRNRLMQVHAPQTLEQHLATQAGVRLLCHPQAEQRLAEALRTLPRPIDSITLLVGPEAGWSADEQALATRHTTLAVRFGPRVLRTETAGLALAAAVTALLDW